jgi:hypothetical protein
MILRTLLDPLCHLDNCSVSATTVVRVLPNPISTPIDSTVNNVEKHEETHEDLQTAFFRAQVDEPQLPYLECSRPVYGENLLHLKEEEEEEEEEEGKGNSCASAAEFEELDDATEEALQDRLLLLANNEVDKMSNKKENGVILQRGFIKKITITAPPDFKPKPPNPAKGEPFFPNVDNPGNWSEYTFRPGFKKKDKGGQYTFHSLPTGAVPVPVNDGKREAAGWEFHYKGWKHDEVDNVSFRSGASAKNLFPKKRQGCLDAKLLTKMGLTEAIMVNEDALFSTAFASDVRAYEIGNKWGSETALLHKSRGLDIKVCDFAWPWRFLWAQVQASSCSRTCSF